ncbi:membrane-associated phospholipid phosphatase [Candidatus Mancarchaeum acidiphilum]|uniref:Membrane-associated phospholipid phosphatase n=2 Tax=Candidatus Mancarchaeum acidiphilum TaxID=1920749 RepID=A0A218NPA3_9ARCH|nr:membrane-associated phospholipid phosphatase [Candidatus Mancarchaeum acidiphilum]
MLGFYNIQGIVMDLSLLLIEPYKININVWAFEFMKDISSPPLNTFMALLAKSFLIVIPLLVLYLYFSKKDMNVYTFIVAGIVFYLVSDAIKLIVREPRPCNVSELNWINVVSCQSTFSFPSNHASVLTGLSFFLSKYKYIRVLYIIWLFLVLFGRVYLGLHYFTDILAGMALSIVLYYIVIHFKDKINNFFNGIVKKIFPKLALKG